MCLSYSDVTLLDVDADAAQGSVSEAYEKEALMTSLLTKIIRAVVAELQETMLRCNGGVQCSWWKTLKFLHSGTCYAPGP